MLAFISILLTALAWSTTARCPGEWLHFQSSCFFFSKTSLQYNDARDVCRQRQGYLAIDNTREKQAFLKAEAKRQNREFWIGLTAIRNSTGSQIGWKWEDRTPYDPRVTDWAPGEPSDRAGIESCVHLWSSGLNFQWNDEDCERSKYYLCERPDNVTDLCDWGSGWEYFDDRCIKYMQTAETWNDARKKCQAEDGDLLKVDDARKRSILTESVLCKDANSAIWIGASDTESPGVFTWVDATPIQSFNWAPGQPAFKALGQNCVEAVSTLDFKWRSEHCEEERKFICERLPGSCSDGWQGFGDFCYQMNGRYPDQLKTWSDASKYCQAQGGFLMQIESFKEQGFFVQKLRDLRQMGRTFTWLGLADWQKEGEFIWSDGRQIGYESWDNNQPVNSPGRIDCGRVTTDPRNQGKWHTSYCFVKRSFICRNHISVIPKPVVTPPAVYKCDSGWKRLGGHCFLFRNELIDWDSANAYCVAQTAFLAYMDDVDTASFISTNQPQAVWFGLRWQPQQGQFVWSNGKVLAPGSFTNWADGCPDADGSSGNFCAVSGTIPWWGAWKTRRCTEKFRYVCRKPAVHVTAKTTPRPPTEPWSPACGYDWRYDPQERLCYKLDPTRRVPWVDAVNICRARGGNLASIHSIHEQVFLTRLVQSHAGGNAGNYWIGANIRDTSSGWQWADRSAFNFFNWASGNPRKSGAGPCVEMSPDNEGRWRNTNCGNRYLFICQKSASNRPTPTPEPTVPPRDCKADYMLSGTHWIQDDMFGSASFEPKYKPSNSRLDSVNLPAGEKGCWRQNTQDAAFMSFIEVELSYPMVIKGVVTQGCRDDNIWTTEYKLEYQYNMETQWQYYKESSGVDKLFTANSDRGTKVNNTLPQPVLAIRVRIWPTQFFGAMGLRFDLLGCRTVECSPQPMITGRHLIEDQQITASSSLPNRGPENSRLNGMGTGWVAGTNDMNQWIQADLGHDFRIRAIVTQGRQDAPHWVSWYKMKFGYQASSMTYYMEPYGTVKTFQANTNQNSTVTNNLGAPVLARFIRLEPTAWVQAISLRWEVHACVQGHELIPFIDGPHNKLADTRLTASSSQDNEKGAHRSRLNTRAQGSFSGGWVAKYNNRQQWIQVDLGSTFSIRAVATRGREEMNEWVTAYTLSYSYDGVEYYPYTEGGSSPRIFTANGDRDTIRLHYLIANPILGRYLRLHPWSWYARIALRWEVYGYNGLFAAQYVGCFADTGNDRDLPRAMFSDPPTGLTPELCISECFHAGYRYAGLQYARECFCGNSYGKHGVGRCDMPCTGNRQRTCGGFWANSVYTTGLWSKQSGCKAGWSPYRGKCYLAGANTLSWRDAQTFCRTQHGDLVTINSPQTQAFVFSLISEKGTPHPWIGLNGLQRPYQFEWSDGEPVLYTNWNAWEPNRAQVTEDCVMMYRGNGKWNDDPCERSKAYVCQADPSPDVPPPSTVTPPGCEPGWRAWRWHCYSFIGRLMDWNNALKYCQAFSGSLLRIGDRFEQAYVTSQLMLQTASYWSDLSDTQTPGTYAWSDGNTNIGYTNWAEGQPGPERGKCVMIQADGHWRDEACGQGQRFICQKDRQGYTTPVPTPSLPPFGCADGWVAANGYCYLGVYMGAIADRLSWSDAELYCQSRYGQAELASFHNAVDNQAIWKAFLVGQPVAYWIGLNNRGSDGAFKWSDGTSVSHVRWEQGEPSGRGQCVEMLPSNGNWRTQECPLLRNWICKIRAGIPPSPKPTSPIPSADPGGCPGGEFVHWKAYGSSCYYVSGTDVSTTTSYSWRQAELWCRQYGASLASLASQDEQNFVYGQARGSSQQHLWIGLSQDPTTRGYTWSDGSPVGYTYWSPGQPDDHGGEENCVAMRNDGGYWSDEMCSVSFGFICKKPRGTTVPPVTEPPPLQGGCPNGYVAWRQKCYQFNTYYTSNKAFWKNWTDAQAACMSQGAGFNLLSIADMAEQAFVLTQFESRRTNYWMGMRRYEQHGRFLWVDNTEVGYTYWAPGFPRPATSGQCVNIIGFAGKVGEWMNSLCSYKRSWICQTPRNPALPTPRPTPPGGCGAGWTKTRQGCFRITLATSTWQEAQDACARDGANLASVMHQYELAHVWLLRHDQGLSQKLWLGLRDTQGSGEFAWVDSWPVVYTNWGENQPQPLPGNAPSCVQMMPSDGGWTTASCQQTTSYVCKKSFGKPPYVTPPGTGTCPDEPSGWVRFQDSCYLFQQDLLVATEADTTCSTYGGHLASIHSRAESTFLAAHMSPLRETRYWNGLIRTRTNGFQWRDGTPVNYLSWSPGQPSDKNGTDGLACVSMDQNAAKWFDSRCSQQYAYVCKVPQLYQPTGYSTTIPSTTDNSNRKNLVEGQSEQTARPTQRNTHKVGVDKIDRTTEIFPKLTTFENDDDLQVPHRPERPSQLPYLWFGLVLTAGLLLLLSMVTFTVFRKRRRSSDPSYSQFQDQQTENTGGK